MARYSGALWKPLANNWSSQPRLTRHDLIILHTMVGSLVSTDGYFRNDGYGGAESHFGVGHDGTIYQWQDCVEASTRVLCADLIWREAGTLMPGDELIAPDEHLPPGAKFRRLRRATVTGNGLRGDDLYQVRTHRGTVRCNGKHPWLAKTKSRSQGRGWRWVRTDHLQPDDLLYHIVDPWEVERTWEAGWLAGFLDGEGCLSFSGHSATLSCNQRVGPVADAMTLAFKGYADGVFEIVRDYSGARKPMVQVQTNRRDQMMRLLGAVRPQRLLAKADQMWDGLALKSAGRAVPVQAVERCGRGTIALLGTSTKTYIAGGFAVHNTAHRAEANGAANARAISIETADMGAGFAKWNTRDGAAVPAWTDAQREALARIIAWACATHDIPCDLIPDSKPSRRGVGYHRQGVPGYAVVGGELWSSARGKVCPGPRRIAQIPGIVSRAHSLLGAPSPTVGGDNVLENHRVEGVGNIRLIFPVGVSSGVLARGWVSAAVDGPRTGRAHVFIQNDRHGISDIAWDLTFTNGHSARGWVEIPDGATMINVNYEFPDGGVITLEGLSK